MTELEDRIGHVFEDRALLEEALTHRSFAHENDTRDNERLEFLGDAVLQVAISHAVFERFPDGNEGKLSRARAMLVNTHTLALIAMELGLDKELRLGKGEDTSGGRTRQRSLAALTEAMLGALFLDAGSETATRAVRAWFASRLDVLSDSDQQSNSPFKDPRSRLQESTQASHGVAPTYDVVDTDGPAHAPRFTVEVRLNGAVIGSGSGGNKREAMKNAAADALNHMTQ